MSGLHFKNNGFKCAVARLKTSQKKRLIFSMFMMLKSYFNLLPPSIKFIATGTTTTLISFSVYVFCILMGLHYFIASLSSLVVGILIGYFLNKNIVFSSENNSFLRYLFLWSGLFTINVSLIYSLTNNFSIGDIEAGFIALILIVPVSYLLQKYFVF